MENIRLACSEVYCILEALGESYKNKLPMKFLEFINQNRNIDFSLDINENEYENLKISKDGLVLISFLNLKYWVKDEKEKQKLIQIYKNNNDKKQEKINRYKQSDWLKQDYNTTYSISNMEIEKENTKKTSDEKIEVEEIKNIETDNYLIEIKRNSFFDKIRAIIRKIFNKKKE